MMMKAVFLLLSLTSAALAVNIRVQCGGDETVWCSSLKTAKRCGAVQHCIDTVWSHQTVVEDPSEICQFCENIVTDTRKFIDDKQTQAQVEQYLDKACAVIPIQEIADACTSTVNNDLPELFQMISSQLNPQVVCTAIGLCGTVKREVVPELFIEPSPVQLEPECTDCKKFMTDIKNYLSSQAGQQALLNFIDSEVCADLGSEAAACKSYVEQYAPLVINLLSTQVTPEAVCSAMKLCSAKTSFKFELPLGLEPVCTDCKKFFTDIYNYLSSAAGQKALLTFLDDNVCAILGSEANECITLVGQYAPIAIQLLKTELTPEATCSALELCSSAQVSLGHEDFCTECQTVLQDVAKALSTSAGQKAVETLLDEKLCQMPGKNVSACKAAVAKYLPIVVEMMQKELPVKQTCLLVGFCDSPQKTVGDECSACKKVLGQIQMTLEQPGVQEMLVEFLDEIVCEPLKSGKGECKMDVDTYAPEVLKVLITFLPVEKACSLFKLCSSEVQAPALPAADDDDECKECSDVLNKVVTVLSTPEGQQYLTGLVAEKLCGTGSEEKKCKDAVTKYAPSVIELMKKQLPVKDVCNRYGYCEAGVMKTEGDECMFCHEIFQRIAQDLETPASQMGLLGFLDSSLCDPITTEKDKEECKMYVKTLAPKVLMVVIKELPPAEACKLFSICTAAPILPSLFTAFNNKKLVQTISTLGLEPVCTDCKKFFTDIKDYLSSQAGQKALVTTIDDMICAKLGSEASECDQLVQQYAPLVITMASSYVTPDMACAAMQLCSNSTSQAKRWQAAPAQICTDCETFIADIIKVLKSTEGQKDVINFIDQNLCDQLGGLKDTCNALVVAYYDDVVQSLATDYPPKKVCTLLQVCSSAESTSAIEATRRTLRTSKLYMMASQYTSEETCTVCEEVFNAIRLIDENPYIQTQIQNFLENELCAKLPGDLRTVCNMTVSAYLPELFRLINTELTPQAICGDLGLCSTVSKPRLSATKPRPSPSLLQDLVAMQKTGPRMKNVQSSSTECAVCTAIMTELESLLGNNATEQEIIAAMDKVCSALPDTMHQGCLDFVNTYGPAVIELLVQELKPSEICSVIGLCQSTMTLRAAVGDEECTVCETVILYVRKFLTENSTEQEIEQALEKVCSFLPTTYSQQCDTFVQTYGPLLIKLLSQEVTPEEVCTALGLCNSTRSDNSIKKMNAPMLGASECSWGPSYWCATKDNAKKCQAEEHCRRHVWDE